MSSITSVKEPKSANRSYFFYLFKWSDNTDTTDSLPKFTVISISFSNACSLGVAPNLPTIPSASDFNTVLSSDQNTLAGTHSQHSTSQDDVAGVEEANQGFPAVQLADAQVGGPLLPGHRTPDQGPWGAACAICLKPSCERGAFGKHVGSS